MAYFSAAGKKISRSKADFAPTCQQVAKKMPAKNFDVNLNQHRFYLSVGRLYHFNSLLSIGYKEYIDSGDFDRNSFIVNSACTFILVFLCTFFFCLFGSKY